MELCNKHFKLNKFVNALNEKLRFDEIADTAFINGLMKAVKDVRNLISKNIFPLGIFTGCLQGPDDGKR
jgi:hypothetical protein